MTPTESIWHNGRLIAWSDAKIHVLRRMVDSAKIYRMTIPYSLDELCSGVLETVQASGLSSCYIRPISLRGYGVIGVQGGKNPIETYIACWEWGKYLGEEALAQGVDVCVSSWNRIAPNTLPALSKAGGNYMNSQLIRMEADINGYAEGIALDTNGYISEGSGENIFLIRDGVMTTPPLGTSVLPGITRDTVVQIARDLDIPIVEGVIPREALYIADEVFFTGTAAEITPIRSVDRITVGAGHRGPITERLQKEFFGIVNGTVPDRHGWLTPVESRKPVGV
jgi:branched-chain amino acid aminotransferase